MTAMNQPTSRTSPTRQIIDALARSYQRQGYRGVAIPAGALYSVVDRDQVEQALGQLLDSGDLVAVGTTGVSLHPSARTALLSKAVLVSWLKVVARETGHTQGLYRDTVAAELRTLTTWAASAPLPDDLTQRAAELAGVLATQGLDPEAMDVVGRHGGTPRSRLLHLVGVPPGSCAGIDQVLVHLRNSVSSAYPR
jgi:hypothetical protein